MQSTSISIMSDLSHAVASRDGELQPLPSPLPLAIPAPVAFYHLGVCWRRPKQLMREAKSSHGERKDWSQKHSIANLGHRKRVGPSGCWNWWVYSCSVMLVYEIVDWLMWDLLRGNACYWACDGKGHPIPVSYRTSSAQGSGEQSEIQGSPSSKAVHIKRNPKGYGWWLIVDNCSYWSGSWLISFNAHPYTWDYSATSTLFLLPVTHPISVLV